MILEYGDTSKVKGLDWYLMELRSEKTIESTMRRVGKALHGIFRNEPIEIFIPVTKRDLDVFEMNTGPYVFVRSTSFPCLLRLKSITGVVSLVTEGDTNRPSKTIKVEDAYVQGLIKQAEEEFRNRAIGIEVGSFVRILNGETRDFCGIVEVIGDGKAVVRVTLRTKSILLETPVRNLLNISDIPANQRVYYYCPLVTELVKDMGDEGLKLIEPDLHLDEAAPPIDAVEPPIEEPKRHSRQRTVTALVKKLVLIKNEHDPLKIAKAVVVALKRGEIKAPKNIFIIYCIIKDTLMKSYFKKLDPTVTNYREVIKKFGREYKFSAQQIAKIDPELKIPVSTDEPCKDGRSKEARQKARQKTQPEISEVKPRPKKRRKLSADKCGECLHQRREHRRTPKGLWSRCQGTSDHEIHPWAKEPGGSGPCWCKRFKEKAR
jgi:transcription antitermination factor NusG